MPRILAISFAALVLTVCWTPVRGAELSDEQIYEKIFKKKAVPEVVNLALPIYFENATQPLGTIDVQAGRSPGEVKLSSKQIFSYLEKFMAADIYRPMEIQGAALKEKESADPEQGWVPISLFEQTEYKVVYDDKRLELRIHVPPELRRETVRSLSGFSGASQDEPTLQPLFFSNALNINATEGIQTFSVPMPQNQGRTPLLVQLQNNMNIGGYVFEANGTFSENKYQLPNYPSWIRGDFRLVADNTKLALRETAGDIIYGVRGFQQYAPMGGLSVVSQFGLQPSKLTVATGEHAVYLKRPSKIEIYINEIYRQTLSLPAGRHVLRDFPFSAGLNNLKLLITDDLGQTETVEFPFFSSSDLLGPGIHQVSYSAGFPSFPTPTGGRSYETASPSFSFYHLMGLTQHVTIGANAQRSGGGLLIGGEALATASAGAIGIEPAFSRNRNGESGLGLRGKFRYLDNEGKGATQRTFGVQLVHKSPRFTSPFAPEIINNVLWETSFSYGQVVAKDIMASINFGYNFVRPSESNPENSYTTGLSFQKTWKKGPNTSAQLSQTKTSRGSGESTVSFALSWSFPEERQNAVVSYDAMSDATNMGWSYSAGSGVGAASSRLGVNKRGSARNMNGQVQYTANRATLGLSHSADWQAGERPTSSNLTSLNLGTALVFAGGRFAISRPVSDSFLIVATEKNLRNEIIDLNASSDGTPVASTDWLGPAVLPDVSSYISNQVTLGQQKVKLGLGIDQDKHYVRPTYKSGYLLRLGSDPTVSIAAHLIGISGTPIADRAGTIRSLSDPDWAPQTIFTTKSGKIRIDNLKPGPYEIAMYGDDLAPTKLEIPETSEVFLQLGKIPVIERKK